MAAPKGKMSETNGAAALIRPAPGHQDWSLMPEPEYKRCTKCGETKALTEFICRWRAGGRKKPISICRVCHVRYTREWRRRNREKARGAARRQRERDPEGTYRGKRVSAVRHPEKQRAWRAVYRAVRRGDLIRPAACESCGSEGRIQAHHDDYSKQLEVRWLCQPCHADLHRAELGSG